MHHHGLARAGATERHLRGPRPPIERVVLRSTSPRQSQAFLIGRSLAVCTVLAAGVAGAVVASDGHLDAVTPARAAVIAAAPEVVKPRVRITPQISLDTAPAIETPASQEAAIVHGRLDRVPLEYLLPDPPAEESTAAAILEFGPRRISRQLVETIVKAAKVTESDPVLLMAIADKESSFLTDVKARTSSATGLFQFIERTWFRVVRDFGAKHGLEKEAKQVVWGDDEPTVLDAAERARILDLRRDPYLSAVFAAEMLKQDSTRIAKTIGRDLSHAETYLAHFLGPDDAERFLGKVVNEPKAAAAKLLPRPARANRPIFFARAGRKAKALTVAQVHEKFGSMMTPRLERYRAVQEMATAAAVAEGSSTLQ